ncbi:hypothetical protein FIBSPDRAFT_528017 [Athelia psychrophila]|uniref:F-box domain-containing protein n=1 Tax=Athelia psychrophila TaxID=1759441 RepID=A0A167TJ66_9AGAM|nr:hypothetical protein FIBSPDRAFT_528017 [Fibularhizoctonia sp. CBS 109695]
MSINLKNLESQIALAKMWLLRAGKHPLSIYLDMLEDNQYPDASFANLQPLVDVFVARCEQWRTIELSLPSATIKHFLGAKDRLHCLERLSFMGDIDWDISCQDISVVFATAPKLRSLSFDNLYGTQLQLPWQQLHDLSVDGEISAQSCLDILKTAPSLQECEFWIRFTETGITQAPSSITLPMLRSMTIWFSGNPQDLPYFFSTFHLPTIQELAIYAANIRRNMAIPTQLIFPSVVADAIVAMISHGSLLKLGLSLQSTTQITPASAVSILRAAPNLMELSLMEGAALVLSREFVDQFNASNACLVPKLQKLELQCLDGFDIHIALAMIEDRYLANYRNVNPLKQLLLKWDMDDPIDSALTSRLILMTHSGLDVQLCNDTTPIELA